MLKHFSQSGKGPSFLGEYAFESPQVEDHYGGNPRTLRKGVMNDIVVKIFPEEYANNAWTWTDWMKYGANFSIIKGKSRSRRKTFVLGRSMERYDLSDSTKHAVYTFSSVKDHHVLSIWHSGREYVMHVWNLTNDGFQFEITKDINYGLTLMYLGRKQMKKVVQTQKASTSPAVLINPRDIIEAYYSYLTSSDANSKVLALAKAVNWNQNAIRITVAKSGVTPEIQKKWDKVTKIRQRAGHDATGLPEKEVSLRMALKVMDTMVDSSMKVITLEEAERCPADVITLYAQHQTVPVPPAQKAQASSGTQSAPRPAATHTPPPPGQGPDDEVQSVADTIMDVFGTGSCSPKYSKVRISIAFPSSHMGNKPVFAMFGKSNKIQIMCKIGDQIGWTEQDSAGTPCVNLNRPPDLDWVRRAAEDARAVLGL